jgi:hypothetical protein
MFARCQWGVLVSAGAAICETELSQTGLEPFGRRKNQFPRRRLHEPCSNRRPIVDIFPAETRRASVEPLHFESCRRLNWSQPAEVDVPDYPNYLEVFSIEPYGDNVDAQDHQNIFSHHSRSRVYHTGVWNYGMW